MKISLDSVRRRIVFRSGVACLPQSD